MNHAVLFDLDGVIIDSRAATATALQEVAARALGHDPDFALLDTYTGRPPIEVLTELGVADPRLAYEQHFDAALFDAAHHIRPIQAVTDGIAALAHTGTRLGIVTAQARRRVSFLIPPAVANAVSVVITADDAPPKPAPDPILLACARLGVLPEETLFLGDTPTDVRAGSAAGVQTLAVAWGFSTIETLRAAGADVILDNPARVGPELLSQDLSPHSPAPRAQLASASLHRTHP